MSVGRFNLMRPDRHFGHFTTRKYQLLQVNVYALPESNSE